MACSLCISIPGMLRSGSEASAASRKTTMWSSAACSDWSIQSMLPDMWQALRVTSTRWLTESRRAVALWRMGLFCIFIYYLIFLDSLNLLTTIWGQQSVTTWHPGGWDPAEGTWIWPRRPPCEEPKGKRLREPPSVCRHSWPFQQLPWADAFGHGDDVTEAGWRLDLCPRAHRHCDQLLGQSVANLQKGIQRCVINPWI